MPKSQAELAAELLRLGDQLAKVDKEVRHKIEDLQTSRIAFDVGWSVIPNFVQR